MCDIPWLSLLSILKASTLSLESIDKLRSSVVVDCGMLFLAILRWLFYQEFWIGVRMRNDRQWTLWSMHEAEDGHDVMMCRCCGGFDSINHSSLSEFFRILRNVVVDSVLLTTPHPHMCMCRTNEGEAWSNDAHKARRRLNPPKAVYCTLDNACALSADVERSHVSLKLFWLPPLSTQSGTHEARRRLYPPKLSALLTTRTYFYLLILSFVMQMSIIWESSPISYLLDSLLFLLSPGAMSEPYFAHWMIKSRDVRLLYSKKS